MLVFPDQQSSYPDEILYPVPVGTASCSLVWRSACPEVVVGRPKAEDDQDKRIEDLKRRAEELCDGQMEVGELDDCPADMEESFWKHVVDYEEAPGETIFQQLGPAVVSS